MSGASTHQSVQLAAVAAEHKVKSLLLPTPYFFPYQQEDLDAFCRQVAASTSLPILLYNLPQFTSGLEAETVRRLIVEVPNIIGIKDSSGSLDILRDLTARVPDACRIVGIDSALCAAIAEDVFDGVVSGVTCVLPELVKATFARPPASPEFQHLQDQLESFIAQLGPFPTPWGLKWIAEARGVGPASFNLPLTANRKSQADSMIAWFRKHEAELTAIGESNDPR